MNILFVIRTFSAILAYIVVFHRFMVSLNPARADDFSRKKAGFYLQGMFEARYNLNSGIVQIDFTTKFSEGDNRVVERQYVVAFDVAKKLLHYHQFHDTESYFFVRDGTNTFYYPEHGTIVSRYDVFWTRELKPTSPFDVRCLGIYGPLYFKTRKSLEEVKERITSQKIIETREDGNGKMTIAFDWGDSPYKTRGDRTIDVDQNYSTVEIKTYARVEEDGKYVENLISEVKTTWTQINGVWLPETEKDVQHGAKAEYTGRYKWNHINEPIDKKWFSFASMEIEDGALLVDGRLGEDSVVEGTFMNGQLELQGEAALAAAAAEARSATARRVLFIRLILVGVGGVMILLAVYWKIKEHFAKKPLDSPDTKESP